MNTATSIEFENNNPATLVPTKARSNALYKHFGTACIQFESMVYRMLDQIAESYNGGYFEFYEIGEGGFYMSLRSDEMFDVTVPFGNGFSNTLSAEATSIVACLFTYCYMAETDDRCVNHYHSLRNFAANHKEAALILGAID